MMTNKETLIESVKDYLNDHSFGTMAVQNLELIRAQLLEARTESYKELCKKREQYRHPKDKDLTDFDRQTMLNSAVADVQANYELVHGLEKLVAERVELIKILLKEGRHG